MDQLISDNLTIYISLIVIFLLVFFIAVIHLFSWFFTEKEPDIGKLLIVLFLAIYILLMIIGTGLIYSRMENQSVNMSAFEILVYSFDITLAYGIIVFFVFLVAFFLVICIYFLLLFLIGIGNDNLIDVLLRASPYVALICSFFIIKFLFVSTIDLQEFLFGEYNPTLGWNYPNSFRLSVAIENFISFIRNTKLAANLIELFSIFDQ